MSKLSHAMDVMQATIRDNPALGRFIYENAPYYIEWLESQLPDAEGAEAEGDHEQTKLSQIRSTGEGVSPRAQIDALKSIGGYYKSPNEQPAELFRRYFGLLQEGPSADWAELASYMKKHGLMPLSGKADQASVASALGYPTEDRTLSAEAEAYLDFLRKRWLKQARQRAQR